MEVTLPCSSATADARSSSVTEKYSFLRLTRLTLLWLKRRWRAFSNAGASSEKEGAGGEALGDKASCWPCMDRSLFKLPPQDAPRRLPRRPPCPPASPIAVTRWPSWPSWLFTPFAVGWRSVSASSHLSSSASEGIAKLGESFSEAWRTISSFHVSRQCSPTSKANPPLLWLTILLRRLRGLP